jgi:hypothetical protein
MPQALESPIVVDFPLRGEGWMAVTTPAARIPSHGTDMLGQRYAYDFLKVDLRPGVHFHPASSARLLLLGGRTKDAYAWGEPIHSPVAGVVVGASDGTAERSRIYPMWEALRAFTNALTFRPSRLGAILGNHVLLRFDDMYAAFAHIAPGTVAVREGQRVEIGEVLGRVGHTGNSTSPHLHFQVMDSLDMMKAEGIPCAFRSYEVERNGRWVQVSNGVPGSRERLRCEG